jgi:hypothetical protein
MQDAGIGRVAVLASHVGVLDDRVHLPPLAVRVVEPHLGLAGVAAVHLPVADDGDPGGRQPLGGHVDVGRVQHLDAQVVHRPGVPVAGHEAQLEGRVVDGEVGVVRPLLRRGHPEERPVEGHGGVEVVHGQRELHSAHATSLSRLLQER